MLITGTEQVDYLSTLYQLSVHHAPVLRRFRSSELSLNVYVQSSFAVLSILYSISDKSMLFNTTGAISGAGTAYPS